MATHDYHISDPPDQTAPLRSILTNARTIAVVGHSHKPHRASYQVAQYLRQQGYEIYPINPRLKQIDDRPCYPTLSAVPVPIDIVNVFRRSEFLPNIATAVLDLSPLPGCFWTQLDIYDATVAQILNDAGIPVVMDACIKIEHRRLLG